MGGLNVALRKESVDRNKIGITTIDCISSVALRKESVDRNVNSLNMSCNVVKSLSARRAWIEIKPRRGSLWPIAGRSPQGERG